MAKLSNAKAVALLLQGGAKPLEEYPGSQAIPWIAQCISCGKTVTPRVGSIIRGRKACKYCFQTRAEFDITVVLPWLLDKQLEPLEEYPGNTHTPWRMRCLNCGREVAPNLRNLRRGQGGCFRCGTDYGDLPAKVYLIHNSHLRAVKIGITNSYGSRLQKYPGWELLRVIDVSTGTEAASIEAMVLRAWRLHLGLKIKLKREDMPMKGYTETADEAGVEVALQILDSQFKVHIKEPVSRSNRSP